MYVETYHRPCTCRYCPHCGGRLPDANPWQGWAWNRIGTTVSGAPLTTGALETYSSGAVTGPKLKSVSE